MRATWYDQDGPLQEVQPVGRNRYARPEFGEVLLQVVASDIDPSDYKLRGGFACASDATRMMAHSIGAVSTEKEGDFVSNRWLENRSGFGTLV